MTKHMCRGSWTDGPVRDCEHHVSRGTSAPDVRPFDDRRTRLRIEGVAKTGQTSPKGTVEHLDYWSGRMAVTAKPAPISVKLFDMPWFRDNFEYRDGKLIEKATGKEVAWTQKKPSSPNSKPSSLRRKPTGQSPRSSVRTFAQPGVSIGNGGVPLPESNQQR